MMEAWGYFIMGGGGERMRDEFRRAYANISPQTFNLY
jgi:hypothetical protein